MSRFTVVYDACVLYPAPLRDFLLQLALTDLFRAAWTDRIHDEWIENLLRNRSDLKREQLERTRRLMNANVRDCLIVGYELYIEAIELPDPDDRHVVAAAIHAKAGAIVTLNLKDFPAATLKPLGIEAIHPDDFIDYQIGLSSSVVCTAAKQQRARLRNPPKSVDDYLLALERQGLPRTVAALRFYRDLL